MTANGLSNLHKCFVYGTLKRGQPNHYLMVERNAQFVGEVTTVHKLPLIISTSFNVPYLLNKPGHGKNVRGELYLIDDETKEFLDIFEGVHQNVYSRLSIEVRDNLTNEVHTANAYLLDNFNEKLLDGDRILFENYNNINEYYGTYTRHPYPKSN